MIIILDVFSWIFCVSHNYYYFVCRPVLQRAVTMIPGHNNPLAAMAFNRPGTRLATASEKVRIMSWMTSRNTYCTCVICDFLKKFVEEFLRQANNKFLPYYFYGN